MEVGEQPAGRRTVLLGFAESLSAPEAAFSLIDAGYRVVAFTRKGKRPALARCGDVTLHEIAAPEDDLEAAEREFLAAIERFRPDALFPLEDLSLFLTERRTDAGTDIPVVSAAGPQARLALDKRLQLDLAGRAGLAVPATRIPSTRAEALAGAEFPLIAKAALAAEVVDGRLGRSGGRICMERADLEDFLGTWDESSPLLIQPFVPGVGEGVFGLATDDGVVGWSGHRRVRMMNPRGSGSSACVARAPDEAVREPIQRMLREAGWRGLFMVELLRDSSGALWFMELNGRSWGSMALARRMGFEYPAWATALALDSTFRPSVPAPRDPIVCRHVGRELVHLLFVLRGSRGATPFPWPGRLRTVLDLLRVSPSQALYNWRGGNIGVFLADTWSTVRDQVFRSRSAR